MSYGTVQAEKMTTESGYSLGAGNASSFKNRIINGAMVIDQRTAGTSTTITTDGQYVIDRWKMYSSQASKYSVQQNAGSVTPPVGYQNYLGVTSLSAYSVPSGDYFLCNQSIEGYNAADLAWGTSDAKTVTLSFWVRSSLTGTFGGSMLNPGFNRTFAFTYTINSANTWEYKTVTVTGCPDGTWPKTTGIGIDVRFVLGAGSARLTSTVGSWVSSGYDGPTGSTSVVGTNGATWYITGVQVEVGTVATSFDFRSIGTELVLCQRYYYQLPTYTGVNLPICTTFQRSATTAIGAMLFPVTMRAVPSINVNSGSAYFHASVAGSDFDISTLGYEAGTYVNKNGASLGGTFASGSSTAGYAGEIYVNSASAVLGFSAEL